MNFWNKLEEELNNWVEVGNAATFWWRDDDCVAPTKELDILLEIAGSTPINLAVIPKFAQAILSDHLVAQENVSISQHGWAHENHAPADQKKAEFQHGRSAEQMARDIQSGHDRLSQLFPDQFLPVFVPPWNRISEDALSGLTATGHQILSTFNAANGREPKPRRVNTHMDVIDWRGSRGFAGGELVLGQAIRHLKAKREDAAVDPLEPTGLLTHHLVHDQDVWNFLRDFNQFIAEQTGAEWCSISSCLTQEGRIG